MYKLETRGDHFAINEIPTDQIIFMTKSRSEADKKIRALSGDVAFQGWTPSFLLQKAR